MRVVVKSTGQRISVPDVEGAAMVKAGVATEWVDRRPERTKARAAAETAAAREAARLTQCAVHNQAQANERRSVKSVDVMLRGREDVIARFRLVCENPGAVRPDDVGVSAVVAENAYIAWLHEKWKINPKPTLQVRREGEKVIAKVYHSYLATDPAQDMYKKGLKHGRTVTLRHPESRPWGQENSQARQKEEASA